MSDHSDPLPPSHETPIEMESAPSAMEVDREVDMPPPALPPPALPQPAPLEPARGLIPEWDSQANTLQRYRGRCVDLHSRRAEGTQSYYWFEALATVS